nr:hypothetical protein [Pararobbsia alpina]
MLIDSLQDQLSRLRTLDEQIARIEQRILEWLGYRRLRDGAQTVDRFRVPDARRRVFGEVLLSPTARFR